MELITAPDRRTDRLGGTGIPDIDALQKMHASQYILHAAGGRLGRVDVEKTLLPHSNNTSPQAVTVDRGAGDLVYVQQPECLCRSTDGGRTWTSRPIEHGRGFGWKVLADSTFISVDCATGVGARGPATVWASADEGRTWIKRAEIPVDMPLPNGEPYSERYLHRGLSRLADDSLLWTVDIRNSEVTSHSARIFLSTDGGHSWQGPGLMIDWGSEGGSTLLPSGRVFATMRYQRERLPSDTNEMYAPMRDDPEVGRNFLERFGRTPSGFKNLFVMESDDRGLSWTPPRMLCTV